MDRNYSSEFLLKSFVCMRSERRLWIGRRRFSAGPGRSGCTSGPGRPQRFHRAGGSRYTGCTDRSGGGVFHKNKEHEFLTENNVELDYELAEPLYLDCTKEQIEVLDKIEKEAHTYEEVTNIYTEDEVGAIIKTNTNVDLKSVINNIQKQLIAK